MQSRTKEGLRRATAHGTDLALALVSGGASCASHTHTPSAVTHKTNMTRHHTHDITHTTQHHITHTTRHDETCQHSRNRRKRAREMGRHHGGEAHAHAHQPHAHSRTIDAHPRAHTKLSQRRNATTSHQPCRDPGRPACGPAGSASCLYRSLRANADTTTATATATATAHRYGDARHEAREDSGEIA